jgi:hypothetical protein
MHKDIFYYSHVEQRRRRGAEMVVDGEVNNVFPGIAIKAHQFRHRNSSSPSQILTMGPRRRQADISSTTTLSIS